MSKEVKKQRSLLVNGKGLIFDLRRSKRAKNVLLKVDVIGQVEVVVPWRVSYRVAERFVREQAEWLQQTVERRQRQRRNASRQSFATGAPLSVLGDVKQLIVKLELERARSRFKEEGDYVEVVVNGYGEVRRVLEKWYRVKARYYFDQRVAYFEKLMGVKVNKVVVSGARTQWGSCIRNKGRVSLQWRLIQAPLYVVDYVIVHEIMHLKASGHNKIFWSGVEKFCPEYKQCRKWLKERGQELYWE